VVQRSYGIDGNNTGPDESALSEVPIKAQQEREEAGTEQTKQPLPAPTGQWREWRLLRAKTESPG
jgi:hypothetical protein